MIVSIAFIADAGEALLLRAQFESLGCTVQFRPIGKPSDLFSAFDQPSDVAVLCGHGDDAGLVFPAMAAGVDSLVLADDRMPAGMVRGFARPLPKVFISTACGTGTRAFADAFHAAGAELYIAPVGYPSGVAVPVLINLMAYAVICRGLDWPGAVEVANAEVLEEDRFGVFCR